MVNVQAENDKAKRANGGDPIVTQTSERALLSYLLTRLHLLDPDVIVGHNIGNWDLNILLVRMQLFKVVHWSRVGRIKRQRMPNLTGGGNMYGGGASQVRNNPSTTQKMPLYYPDPILMLHCCRVGRIKQQRMPNLTGDRNVYGGGASQVRNNPSTTQKMPLYYPDPILILHCCRVGRIKRVWRRGISGEVQLP
jgi:hypothetical protein